MSINSESDQYFFKTAEVSPSTSTSAFILPMNESQKETASLGDGADIAGRVEAQNPYPMYTAIWSLVIISFIGVSQTLERTVMSSFYGITSGTGVKYDFVEMKRDPRWGFDENGDRLFNGDSYGHYQVFYSVGFIPSLLLIGPLTQIGNRKLNVGIASICSSVAVIAHTYAQQMWHLYLLSFLIGFF